MEKSSFFNSVSHDRTYKAEDWAEYFSSFIGNGVFAVPSAGLKVMANEGMTLTVKSGKAWINGYFYFNTSDFSLTLATADGVLKRIDRIVVRCDLINRIMSVKVKSSPFSASPTAPELQRDSDIYELALADITIGAGTSEITQNNITDQRLNSSLCGVVTSVVQRTDTAFQAHIQNKSNPHGVTLRQIGGSNANILDNWDFSNPVNQRGQTTYSQNGAYSIDRWKTSGKGTLTLNSGYISLQRTGEWYNFSQIIDNPGRFAGKTLTLSVKGSGHYSIIFNVNQNSYPASKLYNSTDIGIVSVTYTLPDSVTQLAVVIQSKNTAVVNNIYSAKLEIGEISTLENDIPMDYQSEYLKCLRYYYKGGIMFASRSYTTDVGKGTYYYQRAQFPVPMRIIPSLKSLVTFDNNTVESVNFSGVQNNAILEMQLKLTALNANNPSDTKEYALIEASADL